MPLTDLLKVMDAGDVPAHIVWMQYTGLKDKNGTEIYEGEIVLFYTNYYYHKDSRKTFRYGYDGDGIKEVVRIEDGLLLPFYDGTYIQDEQGDWFQDKYGFEVIGNIYENPNLCLI